MKPVSAVLILIVALSFALSAAFYSQMPEMMASHWNMNGEVDGYMPRLLGIFLLPVLLGVLGAILMLIPRIDPLKENVAGFVRYYHGFVILFSAFLLTLHAVVIMSNLGFIINMNVILPLIIGGLFYYLGILCSKTKRNWFIGIRTPWTLSSDEVWEKTHKLGGRLFKASGIIAVIGALVPSHSFYLVIGPVIVSAAYTMVFSYFEYKKVVLKASRKKR